MYSPELLDHFQNPRNPGTIVGADALVEVENPACGDVLQLSATLSSERIAKIAFLAKGCVPAMACGSALTTLVQGKTLDEVRNLSEEELVVTVGGLPEASSHAAHLAIDALARLLRKLTQVPR